MIVVEWDLKTGWEDPHLRAYEPLPMIPASNVLQYATTCYEGLKLYRGYDGKLRMFRPELNAQRMARSAVRISLPSFEPAQWLKLLDYICGLDGARWLPKDEPGTFLYLRPFLMGTDPCIVMGPPQQAALVFFIQLMPIQHDVPGGMKLLASSADSIRAWPGGFGNAKLGANYGPTLKQGKEAKARGFAQVLWLFPGKDGQSYITEAGAANFFVLWKTREGRLQMITAPLDSEMVLEGVTRRSLMDVARERLPDIEVVERDFTIQELEQAVDEKRIVEAFVAGTAYFVSAVSGIENNGKYIEIPMAEKVGGTYALKLRGWISDIMYGRVEHEWGHVVEEGRRA